jgi:hypothetical protein
MIYNKDNNNMEEKLQQEFDRQLKNLITKDYPALANLKKEELIKLVEPLKKKLDQIEDTEVDLENGIIPFVIVISSILISPNLTMSKVEREGKKGVEKMFPHTPSEFSTIESVLLPENAVYLLINVDRGKETLNITPNDALEIITNQNRTPLTIDEGIAIVTQYPDFLKKNNCFSLLASRIPNKEQSSSTNKRVPAIWINSKKEPNLGWCWAGNPHTWLGSASCAKRIG